MRVNKSPNLLKCFDLVRESFAIIGGRLYTIHTGNRSKKPENFLYSASTFFPIEESEELLTLENEYYDANKLIIEKEIRHIINDIYIKKINVSSDSITSLENILSRIPNQDKIGQFVLIDVVNAYQRVSLETRKKKISSQASSPQPTPEISNIEYPSINELKSDTPLIESLTDGRYMLAMGGRVYKLMRGYNPTLDEFVKFKGKKYSMVFWKDLADIEKEYSESIQKHIHDKSESYGKKYNSILTRFNDIEKSLKGQLNQFNIPKREVSIRSGKIGYHKLSSSRHRVYIRLDPYVIKKNGNYYHFNSVKLGTDLIVDPDTLSIVAPCEVLHNEYYLHPFVKRADKNKICYAGGEIWNRLGVIYNHKYSLKDKNLARIIGTVLHAAHQIMTKGYTLDNIIPVNQISGFTPMIGGFVEAKNYTIYDNDKRSHFI